MRDSSNEETKSLDHRRLSRYLLLLFKKNYNFKLKLTGGGVTNIMFTGQKHQEFTEQKIWLPENRSLFRYGVAKYRGY